MAKIEISTADVKLNKTDINPTPMIILHSETEGYMLVDAELFNISANNWDDIEVSNEQFIANVNI